MPALTVYRITARKYAGDISGTGAAMAGGRWNRKGTPVLYASQSPEVALLEILVQLPAGIAPELDILAITIPDSVTILDVRKLPANWAAYPAPAVLAETAQQWIDEAQTLALKVPCCIIEGAYNYILNCRHPRYGEVKVTERKEFVLDGRLRG